jgi:hypothetical protein
VTEEGNFMDFGALEKAVNDAGHAEKTLVGIVTLAVEYEASTITAERFAKRTCEMLRAYADALKKK